MTLLLLIRAKVARILDWRDEFRFLQRVVVKIKWENPFCPKGKLQT